MLYAFHENFVLPLSHDEVVHGKTLPARKNAGRRLAEIRQPAAALRLSCSRIPGKSCFSWAANSAQRSEFWEASSVDWALEDSPWHRGIQRLVGDLNRLHVKERALHEVDFEWSGFEWIEANDAAASVLSFLRRAKDGEEFVVVVCNFTPVVREEYRVGVPRPGFYREILNTDSTFYEGTDVGNSGGVRAEPIPVERSPLFDQAAAAPARRHVFQAAARLGKQWPVSSGEWLETHG